MYVLVYDKHDKDKTDVLKILTKLLMKKNKNNKIEMAKRKNIDIVSKLKLIF